MKWTEDFATGVETVDDQHKMIFRTIADFRESLELAQGDRTYGNLLEFLHQYCRGHFAHEERCMVERKCAVAEVNAHAHRKFIETFETFRRRYDQDGFRAVDAKELLDLIQAWLTDHICKIDVRLRLRH